MTNLGEKTVQRRVLTLRGEPLIVALTPQGIELREPRRRKGFLLPYGDAFMRAVRLDVEQQAADKPKRTKRVRRGLL